MIKVTTQAELDAALAAYRDAEIEISGDAELLAMISVGSPWFRLKECGGGLHFSPSPKHARTFNQTASRYIACPVALAEIAVHPDGDMPEKVKARGCCGPVWEVDEDGNPTDTGDR